MAAHAHVRSLASDTLIAQRDVGTPSLEILILGEIETEERGARGRGGWRKGWIEAATSNKRGEVEEAGSSA